MRARKIEPKNIRALAASIGGVLVAGLLTVGMRPDNYLFHAPGEDWHAAYSRAYAIAHLFTGISSGAFVLAAIVPLVVLFRRARARELDLDALRARGAVTGFSVAPDGHGFSVAIGSGDATTFYEVDTLDGAREIARAVGKRFPADGDLKLTLPLQAPTPAIGAMTVVALAYAVLLPLYVSSGFDMLPLLWTCSVPLIGMLAALVMLRTGSPMRLAWGTAAATKPARPLDRSPLERHVRRHLEARLTADPAPPRVRVDLLARKDDTVGAWLARIDGLRAAGGYRDEVAPRELLFETLADDHAPIDVRLASARLLRVRDREDPARIRVGITDEDVRVRVDAVTIDDAEAAVATLDAIGPMFRARD